MRYADFRAERVCVGSRMAERGWNTTVGSRWKQSGIRWTVKGAEVILALRCCVLGDGYDEFGARRAKTRDVST